MRIPRFSLAVVLALAVSPAVAAEASVVTIAEGSARLLRGTVWYRLVPGAAFQEGDVIEAGERTTVQVELAHGGTLNLVGPGALYGAAVPSTGGKNAIEFGVERGWLKFAVAAPGAGARVRTPGALVAANDAIIVAHYENRLFELFVEAGSARLSEAARAGRDGPAHEAKAGEYWSRDGDKPFSSEPRAPVKFVASMPRHQIDKLAALAPRFKGGKPALAVDREITLAEADPWLAGPYRRTFMRRLAGRLSDPAFRKAVEANIAAYPEFDRALHPEKFSAGVTAASPAAPAAASGAVPAPVPLGVPAAKPAPAPSVPPGAPAKPGARTSGLGLMPALSFLLPDASEMPL
ncbi:MAG: hypothetical protein ABI812_01030 [Betaproteobacteria bacterium]